MKIGELAGRAGLKPSAIRYYERLGLLAAPHRTGGQRRYSVPHNSDLLCRVLRQFHIISAIKFHICLGLRVRLGRFCLPFRAHVCLAALEFAQRLDSVPPSLPISRFAAPPFPV